MITGYDPTLDDRLKEAEQAEAELARLKPLADEAPHLRQAFAKAQTAAERSQRRTEAMEEARKAAVLATQRQKLVPDFLDAASRRVKELYTLLKEIDRHRQDALQALAIVDRVDYEVEVEESASSDRDARGMDYILAARHGDAKVVQLLESMDPEFSYLRDCALEEPIHRDLAKFVMAHAIPKNSPANHKPAPGLPTHQEPVAPSGPAEATA